MIVDQGGEFSDEFLGRRHSRHLPAVRWPSLRGDHLQRMTQVEHPPVGLPGSTGEPEVQAVAPVHGKLDCPVALAPVHGVLGDTINREPVICEERELVPDPAL
jgi:hypothetical protein